MALEEVQPGQVSDGHGLVLAVPAGVIQDRSAPTVAELTGPGVVALTYGLTADGFNHTVTTADITTSRYTLDQELTREGKATHAVSVKYVYENQASDVVRTTLVPGSKWDIVHRLAVANEDAIANGQILDVIPIECGKSLKDVPTANTELTRSQKLNVIGKVELDAVVGGGAAAGAVGWEAEVTGTPTGGTFTLSVDGFETPGIAYNAATAAVQSAINGLSGVTGVTATVSGSAGDYAITFSVPAVLAADGSGLTGGTTPTVVVAKV